MAGRASAPGRLAVLVVVMVRGVRPRNETVLERTSSVGAYDEPLINGVPRILNLGVPILHEGMATSSNGALFMSRSSVVLGLCSSPGCVMTILKPPGSDSRAMLVSGTVESDTARRRVRLITILSPDPSAVVAAGDTVCTVLH